MGSWCNIGSKRQKHLFSRKASHPHGDRTINHVPSNTSNK
ncbi:hypothetical protein DSM3645_02983 [Blastopirellula marina DSM 3645]|uniref:Uncharacterized protein n=1 Tax=Blastopirellula marina DSM 3645 TaxID=314230 RepID=A3ZVR0_9BACT|nr:hypothetical protein DSM3645_02983 [Blastopirellula marina DSM 3645]